MAIQSRTHTQPLHQSSTSPMDNDYYEPTTPQTPASINKSEYPLMEVSGECFSSGLTLACRSGVDVVAGYQKIEDEQDSRGNTKLITGGIFAFFIWHVAFGGTNHLYYQWLHGQVVHYEETQKWPGRMGNALSILSKTALAFSLASR